MSKRGDSIRKLHLHWNIWFTAATLVLFAITVWVSISVSSTSSSLTCRNAADVSACSSDVLSGLDFFTSDEKQETVVHPDRLSAEVEKMDALDPTTAYQRRVDRLTQVAQDRLFSSRLHGPYSISVLDKLNEMVIGTNLQAYGVSSAEAPVRLGNPVLSAIPSSMPTYGYISSNFGVRRSPFSGRRVHHNGIDIAVNYGSPVYATADGIVTLSGSRSAMGRMVTINHGFGIVTRYGHNSALIVKAGDFVQKGQRIALSGSTGRSTGAHLHYEVWVNGEVVDPTKFMFDVPPSALDPNAELVASQEDDRQNSTEKFRLGFGIGGESGEMHSGPDWMKVLTQTRRMQTVLTLLILAAFSGVCALLVLAAGRHQKRDYSSP